MSNQDEDGPAVVVGRDRVERLISRLLEAADAVQAGKMFLAGMRIGVVMQALKELADEAQAEHDDAQALGFRQVDDLCREVPVELAVEQFLRSVASAYRDKILWAMPHSQADILAALASLHKAGKVAISPGSNRRVDRYEWIGDRFPDGTVATGSPAVQAGWS